MKDTWVASTEHNNRWFMLWRFLGACYNPDSIPSLETQVEAVTGKPVISLLTILFSM